MAKKEKISLDIEVDGLDKATKQMDGFVESTLSLKKQLKEAKEEAMELASAEIVDQDALDRAISKTAELKDKIADTNEQINIFASGSKYERVTNAFGDIKNGLLNMDFEKASERANAFAKAAKDINFGDAIKSVKQMGQTFMTIGKSLLTNPLFLLGAVIALIVVAIVKLLKEAGVLKLMMDMVGKAIDILMIPVNALIQGLKDLTDWFGWTTNAADELAVKTSNSLKDSASNQQKSGQEIIQSLDNQIRMRKLEGKATVDLERMKVLELQKTAKAQYDFDQQNYERTIRNKKLSEDLSKEEILAIKESARVSRLAYQQKTNDVSFFEESKRIEMMKSQEVESQKLIEIAKKEADESKKNREKRSADWKRNLESINKYNKERLDAERKIEDLKTGLMEEGTEKELEINRIKYQRLIADTKSNEILLQNEKDAIVKSYETSRIDSDKVILQKKYDNENEILKTQQDKEEEQWQMLQELKRTDEEQDIATLVASYDSKFLLAEGNDELTKALEKQLKEDLADINDEYRSMELKKEEDAQQKRIDLAIGYAASINSLAQNMFAISNNLGSQDEKEKEKRAKRQFNVQKALSLSMAVIDGFKAITSSLSLSPISIGPIPNPAGIISLAFAAATSAANIAKIASSKYEGGKSAPTAPSIPSIPEPQVEQAPTPPSLNDTGFNDTITDDQSGGVNGGKGLGGNITVTAVVVESEMTETQGRLRSYRERSEIG
jgi:hypothetical protein